MVLVVLASFFRLRVMPHTILFSHFATSSATLEPKRMAPYSFLVFASSLFESSKSLGCPLFLEEGLFFKFWANIRQKFVSGLDVTFARFYVCYCVRLSLEGLTCKNLYIYIYYVDGDLHGPL